MEIVALHLDKVANYSNNNFSVVVVFNLNQAGNIAKAIKGERVGTLIEGSRNGVTASS